MSVEDVQIQDNQEVELENLNGGKSTEEITKPFNPNEIDVDISTVNLGSLIDQLENDEIDLQPDFQRVTDVWDNVKKSRLIESILLGLPLPSFYFSEDPVLWRPGGRMAVARLPRHFLRRAPTLLRGHPRRLSRQDLLGNQAPPALFHQGGKVTCSLNQRLLVFVPGCLGHC